jgi:hypothetical protein
MFLQSEEWFTFQKHGQTGDKTYEKQISVSPRDNKTSVQSEDKELYRARKMPDSHISNIPDEN